MPRNSSLSIVLKSREGHQTLCSLAGDQVAYEKGYPITQSVRFGIATAIATGNTSGACEGWSWIVDGKTPIRIVKQLMAENQDIWPPEVYD